MSEAQRLLELIDKHIVEHGGDLGGWTKLTDNSLQLFDGRVTLTAELKEMMGPGPMQIAHTHIYTKLHEHDDEVLEACLLGYGETLEAALDQIAVLWMTGVAGPIKSFLDNKPICMTCQVGVIGGNPAEGYSEPDLGLTGVRAFVSPYFARSFDNQQIDTSCFDEQKPWFRHVVTAAAPRRVHLAKVTVTSNDKEGWYREVEVDGHETSFRDSDWPTRNRNRGTVYATRFAVFEFPRNSVELTRRAELERTIRYFAENFARFENVDQLEAHMEAEGFEPALIHETEGFAPIAFGRILYEQSGLDFSPYIIRAYKNGTIEKDVPLLSYPAYTRARVIAAQLRQTMPKADFEAVCMYSAEANAIANMYESLGDQADLSTCRMYPCVVPERGVSDAIYQAAMAQLQQMVDQNRKKKPWWKFW